MFISYVGGFYGACNEALMRIELVKNGYVFFFYIKNSILKNIY